MIKHCRNCGSQLKLQDKKTYYTDYNQDTGKKERINVDVYKCLNYKKGFFTFSLDHDGMLVAKIKEKVVFERFGNMYYGIPVQKDWESWIKINIKSPS